MQLSKFLIHLLIAFSLLFIILSDVCANQGIDARAAKAYGKLPLSFVENKGQFNKRVRYVISGSRSSAFFRNDGVTFDLWEASKIKPLGKRDMKAEPPSKPEKRKHAVLKLTFKGADTNCRVKGMDTLPGKVNYIKSNDKSKWHTDISTYKGVIYKNIWRGIDIIYRGDRRQLKYDIRVNPGSDIRKVRFQYDGAQKMWLDKRGDLHIKTAVTEFIERVPGIYQEKSNRKINVRGGYRLLDKHTVGFSVKGVDPSLPLIIDPTSDLVYSTYLGGTANDEGLIIAVDQSRCAYVAGQTYSTDFPTAHGAFDTSHKSIFVTKLNPSGTSILYSTFLIDSVADFGLSMAVDAWGCAYVAGGTTDWYESNFPTTPEAFDTTFGGFSDAFVLKLNESGSDLVYSTFLGGTSDEDTGSEAIDSIAVDSSGCAYVTGYTYFPDFPHTQGAFDTTFNNTASFDAFVTKINAAGSALIYSTFLGGRWSEYGKSIAVDSSGCAYVTGDTYSFDFPTTPGAFDRIFGDSVDAFVTKLNPDGSALLYSTFLGGTSTTYGDSAHSIAVDSLGYAYVAGDTSNADFPTTPGAFDTTFNGSSDGFVIKLNTSGSTLLYSTFLGGLNREVVGSIVIDSLGCVCIAGSTFSLDFPTTAGAVDTTLDGTADAFVAQLNVSGNILLYSTFLGGSGHSLDQTSNEEGAYYIAIDSLDCAYVAGSTWSSDFPTTFGAFDTICSGTDSDAFVAKLNLRLRRPDLLIKTGSEASYSGAGIFNAEGNDQMKSQIALPGQRRTYLFRSLNTGAGNDSFTISGTSGGNGWTVKYYELPSNTDITSQVTGSGWTTGTIAPGVYRGLYANVTPDASVPAGSVKTLQVMAGSVSDSTKIDAVKAVTTFVSAYKPDLLIKTGYDATYSGSGIYSIDGNNQTKSQNALPGQRRVYAFSVLNAGNANDAFRITGPSDGEGWDIKYYERITNIDITSQVAGGGFVTPILAPKAYKDIYVFVIPDGTASEGVIKTLLVKSISVSDNTKLDAVKAVTTVIPPFKPDMLIKTGTEASYSGTGIYSLDGDNQIKSQYAVSGQKVTCLFRAKNAGNSNDTLKITGTGGGSGWTVRYFSIPANADITSQVTGSGWSTGILAPGIYSGLYVQLTPDGTVPSGTTKTLVITTRSMGDSTILDVVKAVTTVP